MADLRQTRRRFLQALTVAAVAVPLWRFLSPRRPQPVATLEIERRQIPASGALVYAESRVAVMCRDGEIYALSLACTHLGCLVTVAADKLVCPCHGSTFDHSGAVLTGPASRPLPRLEVQVRGERVTVFI